MQHILIYTTFPDKESLEKIAQSILTENLAVCIHLYPEGQSLYLWKNVLHSDKEHVCLIKTIAKFKDPIYKLIEEQHPYEVPVILTLPVCSVNPLGKQYVLSVFKTKGSLTMSHNASPDLVEDALPQIDQQRFNVLRTPNGVTIKTQLVYPNGTPIEFDCFVEDKTIVITDSGRTHNVMHNLGESCEKSFMDHLLKTYQIQSYNHHYFVRSRPKQITRHLSQLLALILSSVYINSSLGSQINAKLAQVQCS